MTEPYLILGLPRSRTAWFAAAAMNDHSICYHEPTRTLTRWDDIFSLWANSWFRYTGISDHGLGFWLPEIMERAAPRTVIIDRPIAEVKASLNGIGLETGNFCELLAERLAFQHPRIMRTPYAALANPLVVLRCLQFLMPDAVLCLDRIRELQSLNIQADVSATLALSQSRVRDVAAFLPADVLERLAV